MPASVNVRFCLSSTLLAATFSFAAICFTPLYFYIICLPLTSFAKSSCPPILSTKTFHLGTSPALPTCPTCSTLLLSTKTFHLGTCPALQQWTQCSTTPPLSLKILPAGPPTRRNSTQPTMLTCSTMRTLGSMLTHTLSRVMYAANRLRLAQRSIGL